MIFLLLLLSPDSIPQKKLPEPKIQVQTDLSGVYEIRGIEKAAVSGKPTPYAGIMVLRKMEKDRYIFQSTVQIGSSAVGFGYVRDGYLICVWQMKGISGVTEYRIGSNRHEGRFTHDSTTNWGTETIEFKVGLPKQQKEED